MFNRFSNDIIQDGVDSNLLLNNPVFFKAINQVLNKYAELEENVLTDNQSDVRDIGQRVKHYAMMRRSLIDAVKELDDFVLEGENANYDKEEFGE